MMKFTVQSSIFWLSWVIHTQDLHPHERIIIQACNSYLMKLPTKLRLHEQQNRCLTSNIDPHKLKWFQSIKKIPWPLLLVVAGVAKLASVILCPETKLRKRKTNQMNAAITCRVLSKGVGQVCYIMEEKMIK